MGVRGAQGWTDDAAQTSWRLVPWPSVEADLGGPMGGEGVGGAAGDFTDPVVGGQVDLRAGRVPSSADEVVITPDLASSAGLEVGDTWTVDHVELDRLRREPVRPARRSWASATWPA